MNADVVGMVLAGGRGSRLGVISWKRAKPAVPFGGIYRIIDFTLSNLMYSGVHYVGVMTQYRQNSLMEHLGDGTSWGWDAREARLKVLHPVAGAKSLDWYEGTADAVYRNLNFIQKYRPGVVLVVSGDHIYKMDYRPMIEQHLKSGADITVAGMRVPWEETSRFGVMVTNEQGRVRKFLEKSRLKVSNLASMGIYCFSPEVLTDLLPDIITAGGRDFGKDVMSVVADKGLVMVHEFDGYWRDVGTIDSYFKTNMDAITPESGLDLRAWRVRTNMDIRGLHLVPPAWLGKHAKTYKSMISRGCTVQGGVENSILSPRVKVRAGAIVRNSIIMHNTVIGPNARLNNCVIDKGVVIGKGACLGQHTGSGHVTVVGKGAVIPSEIKIGAGVIIPPEAGPTAFQDKKNIEDDTIIELV